MRSDMMKVIVERPRRGGGYSRGGTRTNDRIMLRTTDPDEIPTARRESMTRRWMLGWNYKELNENLGPLIRYLRSQVGRPWDKVYSEICEHLRADNTVQQHVRDHVEQYVHTGRARREREYYNFFVDDHGILRERPDSGRWWGRQAKLKRRAEEKAKERETLVRLSDDEEFRKINGIWFHQTLGETEVRIVHENGQVHFCKQRGVVKKRQLNSESLREHGLQNDEEAA